MARNGSGSYSPPSNTWNPAVPETAILSDDWNATLADLATALTQSLASDGQTPAAAVIPFAQGIRVSDGLITAPSISVIGDTDTGLYFPAANSVALVCGGVSVLSATSSGVTFPLGVTFAGNQTVTGNLTVNGNTTIGNAGTDTLSVAAVGTFTGNQTFNGTATFTSTVTVPDASFTNAKLANMPTITVKGRASAGSGPPEDLTTTQLTVLVNGYIGDSGSGGIKGLVPAAAAGDAAAARFLSASGAWTAAVPVGSMTMYAANAAPSGWLECGGAVVSRTTYAGLFAAIGTTFNTGGEAGTDFRLPDMRGEFARGWDNGRGIDPARAFGSAQAGAIEAHLHSVQPPAANDDTASGLTSTGTGGSETITPYNTGSTGGSETRPRNIALMFIIKF
jgi:microcystin-dependent protein